jgi:hypothetical protein
MEKSLWNLIRAWTYSVPYCYILRKMRSRLVWSCMYGVVVYVLCMLVFMSPPLVLAFEGAFNANHELLLAARNGDAGRIRHMIEVGAYLEARNNNGVSALILAANNGHLNAVKMLLENYADIEARSNDGRTPLIWAAHWLVQSWL